MSDQREKPVFICLTPIKNEEHNLGRFLRCASQWADHIVIADQQSSDRSRAIAERHPKVTLIDNPHSRYDEEARQRLLLEAARSLPRIGKKVLIALDADEMLTANWSTSNEWKRIGQAQPGTVLRFQWVNVAPGMKRGWIPNKKIPFGFVDDGSSHAGHTIHSPRLPQPPQAPILTCREIKILHYQYVDWERMKSKQRWYQAWERVQNPSKRPVTLYRQYHHMDAAVRTAEPLRPEWLEGYLQDGIDMTTVHAQGRNHWDHEVVDLLSEHGPGAFKRLDLWNVDWSSLSRELGRSKNGELNDPRSWFDKAVHRWLARTQPRSDTIGVRAVQRLLKLAGW